MVNKKYTLLGSAVIIATTAFIFSKNITVERQYSEISEDQKESNSVQEERALFWQSINANVNTGTLEKSDFVNALNQINSMPGKKAADFIELVEEGPNNVGGRTRAICVDVNNSNLIYAGSVSGGLFKSTNKGGSWSYVPGFSENLSIMSMAMTPNGTLYIGTGGGILGEGSVGNGSSGNYGGDGLYQSTDGVTFTQVSGTSNWNISNVCAHPTLNKVFVTGSNIGVKIYDGSSSNASGIASSAFVSDIEISPDGSTLVAGQQDTYISTDGGNSFSKVSGAPSSGKIESGNNARYAISHEKNDNGFYNIYASLAKGGVLGGIWMSPNGGTSWYEIGPGGSSSFAPFGPNAQGWYDNTITVIKGRPNEILMGGIDLWHWEMTTDLSNPWGQWTRVSEWNASASSVKYVHADQHEMIWDKDGNLYFGNDGGVFTFIPPFPDDVSLLSFKHLSFGYNTLQFYSLAHGPSGELLAGAQDNGTQYNNHTGNTYREAFEVSGGDGFDCAISQLSVEGQIYSVYNTALSRSDDEGGSRIGMNVPCPTGTVPGESCGSFNTRFGLMETLNDPNSKDSVDYVVPEDTTIMNGDWFVFTYPSANFAIELKDSIQNTTGSDLVLTAGTSITAVDKVQALFALSIPGTGVFITRDAWKFGQNPEWWKVLGSENGFTGSAVSFEFTKDMQYLFVGTSSGDVWRVDGLGDAYERSVADLATAFTRDPVLNQFAVTDVPFGGTKYLEPFSLDFINNTYYDVVDGSEVTFKINRTRIFDGPASQFVMGIDVDPNDNEHVVISLGGFGAANNIYESNGAASAAGTGTFSSIQGNLPNMPVYNSVIDKNDPNYIIAGTVFGLWYTQNGGTTWSSNNEELGLVPVFRVSQDNNAFNDGTDLDGALYLTTHGRGYWSTNTHLEDEFVPTTVVGVEEIKVDFKSEIQIFPNPVNDIANVAFEMNSFANISIDVMSIDGKVVQTKSLGVKPAGKHRANINTEALPNGIYVIQVKVGKTSKTGKFIKL